MLSRIRRLLDQAHFDAETQWLADINKQDSQKVLDHFQAELTVAGLSRYAIAADLLFWDYHETQSARRAALSAWSDVLIQAASRERALA